MAITLNLEYTPRSPKPDVPFTESSFVRCSTQYSFNVSDIGIALVDLWNFGYDDGPLLNSLGFELSLERGVSHAQRKRAIIEEKIAPVVNELRQLGVRIFHCNHPLFLRNFPQWSLSTTVIERERLDREDVQSSPTTIASRNSYPPSDWVQRWKKQHSDDVFNVEWSEMQGNVYEQIKIPQSVTPVDGDLLVYSKEQFHRLLTETRIKVLFYMGFEAEECIQNSRYGIRNMNQYGYMTNIVRDCTTTYESAETLPGLWRTKVAIETIEKFYGYSITADDLVSSLRISNR
ncbi:hypothetical protein [Alicyclobacillus fodiniaquatilis]|uniref:Nicotinamidase-related amidase n=1 Tax=Alicyclobacillus fodiniaquatilis TaxID=1661150 RepID=A0ABW4JG57_9BACL